MNKIYDVIVYGGGITGCITAIAAAKRGYSVVLAEKKTFLGDFVTSGLDTGCDEQNNAKLKYMLLDSVDYYGIDVLFMSDITAIAVKEDYATGVLVSNRFGQQLIYARAIIDTVGYDSVLEMTDNIKPWNYTGGLKLCLKYSGEALPDEGDYTLPEDITVRDGKVSVRKCFDGNLFASFIFDVVSTGDRYRDFVRWNCLGAELAQKINKALDIFDNLRIIQTSYEVCPVDLPDKCTCSANYPNIKSFYRDFNSGFTLEDINACRLLAEKLMDELDFWDNGGETEKIICRDIEIPISECHTDEFRDHKMTVDCCSICFDYKKYLPVVDSAKVLVAGGGTGGTAAAIAASQRCAGVIIADENPGVGGTQTFGSVCRYYHGYVKGFALRQEEMIDKSSPVYKRFSYLNQLVSGGVRLFTSVVLCGAVCNGDEINGVIIASSDIWGIIEADITVDGTGNADIAAFCGIRTNIGSPRDGNLQNYSQSVIERSGLDLDAINHTVYSEMLRGIKLAHRQYELGDFSTMLTPRAGVCFEGDYVIDMRDILLEKRYEDCIAIAHTDSDAHGAMSASVHYMGFVPYHDRIFNLEVPYRACIPKDFNRLLVAGKSISATADASGYFRMAADVINRGYAIGVAAVMASDGRDVRNIDYEVLKNELTMADILPENRLDSVTAGGDEADMLSLLCMPADEAVVKLKKEYSAKKNIDIAVALGWFGCDEGEALIKKKLSELLDTEEGICYSDIHPNKPGNNKGGVMGEAEVYWQINRIITALAHIRAQGCEELICRALRNFDGGGSCVRDDNDYVYGRIDLQRIPHFDRIRVLCYYIEQCPHPVYTEALAEILEVKGMGGFCEKENVICRNYQNSYIELTVIRTLARCGSYYGAKMLAEYLEDIHYVFSKNAHDELVAVTGVDLGYDRQMWDNMLENNFECKAVPYVYDGGLF